MARRDLLILSLIGVGFGILFYFFARHVARSVFDLSEFYSHLPVLGIGLQLLSLGVVLIVVVVVFVFIGKAFDIHKM